MFAAFDQLQAPDAEKKAYPILHRVIARLLSERLCATEATLGE